MDFTPFWFFFLSGLTASFLLTPSFIWLAHRYGLMDHPAHRKIHSEAIPKTGGLAIVFSVILAATVGLSLFGKEMGYDSIRTLKAILIIGFTFLSAFLGLMDDVYDLRPRQKFLLQSLMVGAFAVLGFRFEIIHVPGSNPHELSFLDVPVSMFWMMAIINGFNFMDGIDGLAGSVTSICLLGIGAAATLSSGHPPGGVWLATFGVVVSFLFFNWRPAKIYLGDSGSMALGTFTTASLIAMGNYEPNFLNFDLINHMPDREPYHFQILTATLLLGYPAIEAALSTFRRTVKRFSHGRSMESSEQDHIHHILMKAGWSNTEIVLSASAIQLVLTSAGLLLIVRHNALAIWLLLPLFIVMAYLAPRLGFFEFLNFASPKNKPHYQIANHFISMQKVKLNQASEREEIVALISQTCQEFGVKSCRLILRPDAKGLGGMDYVHEWDLEKPAEYLGFIHDSAKGPAKAFADRYKLSGGRGGAHWVFEPQTLEEDLDVEYHVLVSDFMREALEAALRLGADKKTLEVPSIPPSAHKTVRSHALRSRQQEKKSQIQP